MKLLYSEEAIADLVRLRNFIAEKAPSAAKRIAQGVISRIEALRRFPALGRPVYLAQDPKSIRDMVFGRYMVRYSIRSESIVILCIWHHNENRDQQSKE